MTIYPRTNHGENTGKPETMETETKATPEYQPVVGSSLNKATPTDVPM
jgi:hypothetical protein